MVLLLSGWLRSPEPASRQVREGGPPLKFYDARDNLSAGILRLVAGVGNVRCYRWDDCATGDGGPATAAQFVALSG
ncbi:MAG: hypothetical protein ABR540_08060, partial [Acidimicrobiales bacterium]